MRTAHPRIGGLVLALSDAPQSVRAWETGGVGESLLGEALNGRRSERLAVLHDRRIPGSKANIDHIAIGPAGVFVIDAKRYSGKVERRDRGWILDRDWRLYVGGRDRTKLVDGMGRQVDAVRAALGERACAVIPVLCFVDATWEFLASPLRFDKVRVLWPKELYTFITSEGPLTAEDIGAIEGKLAVALPSATRA